MYHLPFVQPLDTLYPELLQGGKYNSQFISTCLQMMNLFNGQKKEEIIAYNHELA
jgi:hypothetical protein